MKMYIGIPTTILTPTLTLTVILTLGVTLTLVLATPHKDLYSHYNLILRKL